MEYKKSINNNKIKIRTKEKWPEDKGAIIYKTYSMKYVLS
jgi:hypothetical protein